MKVDLYNKSGDVSGKVDLSDAVFATEPNENAMHQAVVAHLAHKRQGTAKTKTRDEVRGGGIKPWKQKGRGTARSGSTRSPIWIGGGTIHGPKPHEYKYKLSKKFNRLSRLSAYSLRTSENNMKVVEDFTLETVKTKSMAEILKNLSMNESSTLLITSEADHNLWLSARNIPKVQVRSFDRVSTYDILSHKNIMIMQGAISSIENSFNN
jgi:large subunit ribosomal protein L4